MYITDYICKYKNLQIIKKNFENVIGLNFLSRFEQKWVNTTSYPMIIPI